MSRLLKYPQIVSFYITLTCYIDGYNCVMYVKVIMGKFCNLCDENIFYFVLL